MVGSDYRNDYPGSSFDLLKIEQRNRCVSRNEVWRTNCLPMSNNKWRIQVSIPTLRLNCMKSIFASISKLKTKTSPLWIAYVKVILFRLLLQYSSLCRNVNQTYQSHWTNIHQYKIFYHKSIFRCLRLAFQIFRIEFLILQLWWKFSFTNKIRIHFILYWIL